jgi:hypothetical protein
MTTLPDVTLRNSWRVLVCIAAIGFRTICGQTSPSLQDQYQALVKGPADAARPNPAAKSRIEEERVSAASPDEIRAALPWIIAACGIGDEAKRDYGFYGLLAVALRMDSPALLKEHMGDVAALLLSSDPNAQRGAVAVLGVAQDRQSVPTAISMPRPTP